MTIVVVLCSFVLAGTAAWVIRRRRLATSWNRELESAFGASEDRPPLRRHRLR
jgi:hypothetical protein